MAARLQLRDVTCSSHMPMMQGRTSLPCIAPLAISTFVKLRKVTWKKEASLRSYPFRLGGKKSTIHRKTHTNLYFQTTNDGIFYSSKKKLKRIYFLCINHNYAKRKAWHL